MPAGCAPAADAAISSDLAELTQMRRDLHRIPELDDDLPETTAYVRNVLSGLSCEVFEPCTGALCAYFDLGRDETVALRADMDALPIEEATGLGFASCHPGRMHACGHDGHMAMVLAAGRWVDRVLAGEVPGVGPEAFPRNVLLVFQPAEETTGGAKRVCESGVFERFSTTRIFGFHLWPDLPEGVVASRPGPLLARSSETTLVFHGLSAHIAKWREGHDAVGAAARFVVGAKWLSRRLEQDEPCTLRFGRLVGGTVRNAVAGEARVEGSLRVFSDHMFDRARDEVRSLAQTAADEEGCTFDLTFSEGYPPVVNDEKLFEDVCATLPGMQTVPEPLLIAEDFAFYQRHLPGVFLLLGTGTGIPLHADTFAFDERVLVRGLETYRALLLMP
ncbi:amidohydrolase [Collinsella sp. An2]|nr:amidohydrolase [Collinsella sp. An2]